LRNEISHLEEDIKRTKAEKDKELRKGGKFQALEDEVKASSHEIVRLTTVLDLKTTSMKEERKKRDSVRKTVSELEAQLKEKTALFEELKSRYDSAKAELEKKSQNAEKKEELLQTLLTGVASKEGQESGYQGQLQGEVEF
jgi:structural maintenance of chromosome 2